MATGGVGGSGRNRMVIEKKTPAANEKAAIQSSADAILS